MSETHVDFTRRLRKLDRKHTALTKGTNLVLRRDGLIVAQPQRRVSLYPLQFLLLVAVALILFKAALLLHLGPQTYDDRVGTLAQGTGAEKAGAWVMQADPATVYVADQVGALLR